MNGKSCGNMFHFSSKVKRGFRPLFWIGVCLHTLLVHRHPILTKAGVWRWWSTRHVIRMTSWKIIAVNSLWWDMITFCPLVVRGMSSVSCVSNASFGCLMPGHLRNHILERGILAARANHFPGEVVSRRIQNFPPWPAGDEGGDYPITTEP
ncbi:hypothetical protein I7I48_06757 [Histoplasma ohiense]|nr:hypothetical protein I7I48_06757 [Histoplasma ohiense (nom. inval.)]